MATLRELRTNKGHAQNAVAKAIGVSKAAMSAYEVGKRRLPIVRARALAEALGCSIDEVEIGRASCRERVYHPV